VLILVLAQISDMLSGSTLFRAAMDGVAAAAVGLVMNIGVLGAQRFFPKAAPCAVTAATFIAIGILRLPLIPVVLVLAPVSVGLAYLGRSADA